VGIDAVMQRAEAKSLPGVRRVVLVGNKISAGSPSKKPDGTVVRTLWGELAYQLGGKKAFARIKADDEKATSPGDALREMFVEYGPCMILIDEWWLTRGSFTTRAVCRRAALKRSSLSLRCLQSRRSSRRTACW